MSVHSTQPTMLKNCVNNPITKCYLLMECKSDYTHSNVLLQQDGATQWSSADLGSDERKQKFLRLMGAGKVCLMYCRSLYF